MSKLNAYANLIRLDRPVGWLLLLWPTLWAVWLASGGSPGWGPSFIFVVGVFVMRCFGCCVNDIADRNLDSQVARTKDRPLAAKTISVTEAIAVAGFFLLLAVLLWWQLSVTAKIWALVSLPIAATYPLAKRIFKIPQFHLGVAFSMGIPVAYAHFLDSVPVSAILLMLANFCWIFAYDTIYAMIDRADDVKVGNNSSAIWLGDNELAAIAYAYFGMIMLLVIHAVTIGAGFGYFLACLFGLGMALRFCRMIRDRHPHSCQRAFTDNHFLGMLIWLGLVADAGLI